MFTWAIERKHLGICVLPFRPRFGKSTSIATRPSQSGRPTVLTPSFGGRPVTRGRPVRALVSPSPRARVSHGL